MIPTDWKGKTWRIQTQPPNTNQTQTITLTQHTVHPTPSSIHSFTHSPSTSTQSISSFLHSTLAVLYLPQTTTPPHPTLPHSIPLTLFIHSSTPPPPWHYTRGGRNKQTNKRTKNFITQPLYAWSQQFAWIWTTFKKIWDLFHDGKIMINIYSSLLCQMSVNMGV